MIDNDFNLVKQQLLTSKLDCYTPNDRLTNLPLDTIQEYMLECNDILEHNRAHLINEYHEMPTRLATMIEEM